MYSSDVVVTGLGATTPLGGDVATTWRRLCNGESGVQLLHDAWAAELPVRLAAPAASDPAQVLGRAVSRRLDRNSQFAVIAAREAWADAGKPDVDPDRFAVVLGTGLGGGQTMMAQNDVLLAGGPRRMSPLTVPMLMANAAAAAVSAELGARGGAHTLASACAAGAEAIAFGADLIRAGRCDVVVAGGTEACIHPFTLAAFAQMRALSTRNDDPDRASRPFDLDRDGFVLGEGSAMVVLQRGPDTSVGYARLLGSGTTSDAFDMVTPQPHGQLAAMRRALHDADLIPAEIGWVQAHATSTPLGDPIEAGVIATLLGSGTTVITTKAMTGHLLGASGALSAVTTVLSLREHLLPPARNLTDQDPSIDLDVVTGTARKYPGSAAALSNSFGFGGHNVCLAFGAV